jgi:radical SAM superfamily enzyme YgiQ (UPF0313 family)
MKFLLAAINAKYIHSNPAIYSLKAYAGETLGAHVELAEYTINQRTEEILADLYQRRPDVIGFSCYIWNRNQVEALLPEVAKVLPNTEIWLGGPEVSYETDEIFARFPQIRGIMVGEGEETFRELLAYYVDGANPEKSPEPEKLLEPEKPMHPQKSLTEIAGLALPEGRTAPRDEMDMNEVPFLYEDLSLFENRILYYETSRGCPYRCSYCLSSVEKRVRFRKMEEIFKHLQFFLDHKVKQVKFVDRTFNCDRKHADAIWTYLKEHDNGITNFHFEISADILQEEEIALLRSMRPGLVQLEIGVQSCNEDTLQAINRRMQLDELEKIVAAIKEGGNVHQHLDLIAGLPYENLESFKQSFNRVYRMRPDQLQLGFLKLLKGTKIRAEEELHGMVYDKVATYQIIRNEYISAYEMMILKRVENVLDDFYNKGGFERGLEAICSAYENPFEAYAAFANFYYENGYQKASHKKEDNYRILNKFAVEVIGNESITALIYEDLNDRLNFDAVKKFNKKGWDI